MNPTEVPPPVGDYSNVARVPSGLATIHIAGQLPVDEHGAVVAPGDFACQADLAFDRLAANLASAGSSLSETAYIRAYLVSDAHFPLFREARQRALQRYDVVESPPATTIIVSGLYGGSLIELDAVAVARDDD